MKITHIGNAACLYTHQGFTLLTDPWIDGPAFGNWIHLHSLKTQVADVIHANAIYISHSHQDHLHANTLKYFRRDIPIITYQDKFSISERKLKDLGFNNIIALKNNDCYILGPLHLTCLGPFVKHPFHDSDTIGNLVDSALIIRYGEKFILNANDNTLTEEAATKFYENYGSPEVAQLNFNNASCYPACFMNLTHEEKLAEAQRCIMQNLDNMVKVSKALAPRVVTPFAGEFKLDNAHEHLNKYLGTTTAENAAKYLKDRGVNAVALKEGEILES